MPSADLLLQAVVSGILAGGVYSLVAVSLALVFGVMRVLNFAHGDLLMIAMYGVVVLNREFGLSPYVAALVILPLMGLLGMLLFQFLIKPVLGSSPLTQAQLTIGLSFVIQSLLLIVFGADLLNTNTSFGDLSYHFHGVVIGVPQLIGFVVSLLVCGLLSAFLTMTEIGHRIRATSQDPTMAWLCGVDIKRTQLMVFAGCIAILAIPAGCLMTFSYVTPSTGIRLSLLSLLVVVLGGLGDLRGAFVGGLIIGLVESLAAALLNNPASPSLTYLVFGAALLFRPKGLFGRGSNA
ncbi:branched-chain amino acid ABC transporter permease [Bradyrhizobium sp. INPA01-394B]|jgi:branched-chain amino acid transport system permease protein|uniref:Branched-chain amino acid ABC transporter permease n=1 Tax=Bradyrhizobium campsiandrae TaxID=1729892 RepID=A0ABR7UM39_9BRAD|nr:branched-chain amino acid ABC transporter permease [Bradyrhizobium campsiandrae]MBC9883763.1 branched-chain amino acid ABC transporter permease [Bradyrhizobium campsiandrae]MBC9984509.1 branched-chain amino acid ABC transporter permease [Bradyrhizobium campsiandrae]